VDRSQLAEQCLAQGSAYEKLKETSKTFKRAEKPALNTGCVVVKYYMAGKFAGKE